MEKTLTLVGLAFTIFGALILAWRDLRGGSDDLTYADTAKG